jgi:hypothetical protein
MIIHCMLASVVYPGCFIPDPDPTIFSSRILYEKWNANLLFSCFLCFQEQSLSLNSQKDPVSGNRKNSSRIPEVKKHRIWMLMLAFPVFSRVFVYHQYTSKPDTVEGLLFSTLSLLFQLLLFLCRCCCSTAAAAATWTAFRPPPGSASAPCSPN